MLNTCGITVDKAELTDPGLEPSKQVNEDSLGFVPTEHGHLAVVCDGMGGHAHGKAASERALSAIIDHVRGAPPGTPPAQVLGAAIRAANQAVFEYGGDESMMARPGTTCVTLLLHPKGAEIAHVGDSRMHMLRDGKVYRLTRDHSVVQQMMDAGMLSQAEAKEHPDANRITRALGMAAQVDVEVRPSPLPYKAGDVFLLSTDGLTDLVEDEEIQSIAENRASEGLTATCAALVDLAKLRGGHDNITVQMVSVVQAPPMPAVAPTIDTTLPPDQDAPPAPESPTHAGGPVHADGPGNTQQSPVHPGAVHPTLVDPAAARQTVPTQPDGDVGHAGPANNAFGYPNDHAGTPDYGGQASPHHAPHAHSPGQAAASPHSPGPHGPPSNPYSHPGVHRGPLPGAGNSGRLLLILAAILALFIVGAIALWWVGSIILQKYRNDVPPMPDAIGRLETGGPRVSSLQPEQSLQPKKKAKPA